jgi:hypothetical protein
VSTPVILDSDAIATLFPAGQVPAPFDFAQGVPSKALMVFGSIVLIKAIQNTDLNRRPYTKSPIRLKIASVSAEIERACLKIILFIEIRPNYFSIATVTFPIALIQQSYHGVSFFTKKHVARTRLPKRSPVRLMVSSRA